MFMLLKSPHELSGYIKEQAKNLTINVDTKNYQSSKNTISKEDFAKKINR